MPLAIDEPTLQFGADRGVVPMHLSPFLGSSRKAGMFMRRSRTAEHSYVGKMTMSVAQAIVAMKGSQWSDALADLIAAHGDAVMAAGGLALLTGHNGLIVTVCQGYSLPNLRALVSWLGIDPFTVIDNSGYAPLHYLCMSSSATNVAFLLDKLPPSALTLKSRHGNTPLDLAITFKRSDTVALITQLVCAQSLPFPCAGGRSQVVHFTSRHGSRDGLQALIDTSSLADFLTTDMFGQLPIGTICARGNSTILNVLLSKWTVDDLCLTATDQQSLMRFAWSAGDLNTVKLLVQHVPQQHCITQGRDGSVLHKAAATRKTAILQALVNNATADQLLIRDSQGRTALHVACMGKRLPPVTILLSRWPANSWRLQDNNGDSLLHAAVQGGQGGLVTSLMKDMADQLLPLLKNNKGQTFLRLIARFPSRCCIPSIVGLLPASCLYGVDNDGKAPLDAVPSYYMHLWLPKVKSAVL